MKRKVIRIVALTVALLFLLVTFTACNRVAITYRAGEGGSITGNLNQSIGQGKDGSEVIAIPDDGYFFVRWSDGWKYPERQDTDIQEGKTLTAIFAPKTRIYKILMVYVVEIQATLTTADGIEVEVDYRLTETEIKICELISLQMGTYLNGMMDGLVYFEIDTIFTTEVVRYCSPGVSFYPDGKPFYDYGIIPYFIPELQNGQGVLETGGVDETQMDTFKGYDTVITTFNFNDYDFLLRKSSGSAGWKYAEISLEAQLLQFRIAEIPYEALFDLTFSGYTGLASWDNFISTYIHEFAHTLEAVYWYNPVPGYMDYHTVLSAYGQQDTLGVTKKYLFGKAVVNGETGGLPASFWEKYKVYGK